MKYRILFTIILISTTLLSGCSNEDDGFVDQGNSQGQYPVEIMLEGTFPFTATYSFQYSDKNRISAIEFERDINSDGVINSRESVTISYDSRGRLNHASKQDLLNNMTHSLSLEYNSRDEINSIQFTNNDGEVSEIVVTFDADMNNYTLIGNQNEVFDGADFITLVFDDNTQLKEIANNSFQSDYSYNATQPGLFIALQPQVGLLVVGQLFFLNSSLTNFSQAALIETDSFSLTGSGITGGDIEFVDFETNSDGNTSAFNAMNGFSETQYSIQYEFRE